jgi:hypothetical protein
MKQYSGGGAYVLGVPARDLSEDDWAALTDDERTAGAALYQDAPDPQPEQPAEPVTEDTANAG